MEREAKSSDLDMKVQLSAEKAEGSSDLPKRPNAKIGDLELAKRNMEQKKSAVSRRAAIMVALRWSWRRLGPRLADGTE